MTVNTLDTGVAVSEREFREIVIESSRCPCRHVVATGAVVIEIGGIVVGVRSRLKIRFMAGETLVDGTGKLL